MVQRFVKLSLGFALLALLLSLLGACSSSESDQARSSGDYNEAPADGGNVESLAAASEQKAVGTSGNANKEAPMEDDAAAGNAVSGSTGAAPVVIADQDGFNRKLVYKANLTMAVKDFGKASTELRNIIHQSGGYVTMFSDSRSDYEVSANYTIKVPAGGFTSFIEKLELLDHTRFEQQIKGTDVTEEYIDLDARLKAKQVVEARLLDFMDKASRADDLVRFSDQLAGVQEEIERIKGRIRYLDNSVSFSTVELRLYQPSELMAKTLKIGQPLGSRMADALTSSVQVLVKVFEGLLVFAAGALPVLAVLAVIGVPLGLWLNRRRRAVPPAAAMPPTEQFSGNGKNAND